MRSYILILGRSVSISDSIIEELKIVKTGPSIRLSDNVFLFQSQFLAGEILDKLRKKSGENNLYIFEGFQKPVSHNCPDAIQEAIGVMVQNQILPESFAL